MQSIITGVNPSLAVYEADGLTKIADLPTAKTIKWQDGVTVPGSVSFSIPVQDAHELQHGRIVKPAWKGALRQAARVRKWTVEWVVDDTRYRQFDLPGAAEMWNDAVILPEYPLDQRTSGSERIFGPMSNYIGVDTTWFHVEDWPQCVGAPWSTSPGLKHKVPAGLSGPDPWWIGHPTFSPFTNAPARKTIWFRRHFTTYTEITYEIYTTADDYLTLYLDGEQIVTPDQQNGQSFKTLVTVSGTLPAGQHNFAAKVVNSSLNSTSNPVGFLLAMVQTDAKGQPVKGAPIVKTDTNWIANDVNPGWHRSGILRSLHSEGVARGVRAMNWLGISWNGVNDSAGVDFADIGTYTLDVGTQGCWDAAAQLAEHDIDLRVSPLRFTLGAYRRLGSDKSATARLRLGDDGGNIISLNETTDRSRYTTGYLHLADGTWLKHDDVDAVAAFGPIEVGVSLGSTPDDDTAAEVFTAALSHAANPEQSFTIEISAYTGPLLYNFATVGDSILIPNPSEGADATLKVRIMLVTVDCSGLDEGGDGQIRTFLDVVLDPT